MNLRFTLKTRAQFQNLDKKKEQWISIKDQPGAQLRLRELISSRWPRQNCALDDSEGPGPWDAEVLDGDRARQLDYHCEAARRLITITQIRRGLSGQDLLELHGMMLSGNPECGEYRESRGQPLAEGHQPIEFEILPEVVANALEWFDSDSFREMHEVEQGALFLMKLLDILPFQQENGKTLRLAANFFLLRSQFPPALIVSSRTDEYRNAIRSALRFHTQPLIDLLADSVLESLCICLGEAVHTSPFRTIQ